MHRMYRQASGCSLAAQVHPRQQAFMMQKWQHVVAIHTLGPRGIDFQAIAEVEQPLCTVALPDQRVEGRQQCAMAHSPGYTRLAPAERWFPPALLPHREHHD